MPIALLSDLSASQPIRASALIGDIGWRCRSGHADRNGFCGSSWCSTCWPRRCIGSSRPARRGAWLGLIGALHDHPVRFFLALVLPRRWPMCRWPDLFTPGMGRTRPVLVPAQPAAALPGLFLRRLRDRRLWPRSRAAWRPMARWRGVGRVACGRDCGLDAVGFPDLADLDGSGGRRLPGSSPRR